MLFDKAIFLGLGIAIGIYLVYKLLTNKSQTDQAYEQIYNKILNSEEHKVKGQHEK